MGSLTRRGCCCVLQSDGAASWALCSPLIGQGLKLCSLGRRCHWLDSVIRQGCRLGSTITPSWVGAQAMFPDHMEPLAGFQVQAEPQAGYCC